MHAVLLLFLALTCSALKVISNPTGAAALNDTVKVGEAYQISLKSNPTTGFRWELKTKQPIYSERTSVDEFGEFIETGAEQMGMAGKQVFSFVGKLAGEEHFTLIYERPWTKEGAKTLDVAIKVIK